MFVVKVLYVGFWVLRFFSYLWYDYTLTNMNCKTITERLKRVAAIVDSWNGEHGVPQIERDIALEELRAIYNDILVVDAASIEDEVKVEESEHSEQEIEVEVVIEEVDESQPEQEAEEPIEEHSATASDAASFEAFYDALDIDALLGLTDEPVSEEKTEEKIEEPVAEPVIEPEVVEEPTPEPIPEPEPAVEPTPEEPKAIGAGLFDLNDIPVRSKSKRKMISLYSDNPIPAPQPMNEPKKVEPKAVENAPKVEPAPVEEVMPKVEPVMVEVESIAPAVPQQRLGDSFGEVKTLADQMAKDDNPTTPFNRITELRQAIGLNDKFLMIRDLFGGDAERYEATIDTLDEFDDLDECIIYIVENFRWNPDLEATKLLVSLIERKLA